VCSGYISYALRGDLTEFFALPDTDRTDAQRSGRDQGRARSRKGIPDETVSRRHAKNAAQQRLRKLAGVLTFFPGVLHLRDQPPIVQAGSATCGDQGSDARVGGIAVWLAVDGEIRVAAPPRDHAPLS
jgi:hypothetical protein